MITKTELKYWILRKFGYPTIKVELTSDQLDDFINDAKIMWMKYAMGNATSEDWYIFQLEQGKNIYQLPASTTEVIKMIDSSSSLGNANELFTLENYMMNIGMLDFIGGAPQGLIGYYASMSSIKDLKKFTTSKFNWRYYRGNDTIRLNPVPDDKDHGRYALLYIYKADDYEMEIDEETGELKESLYDEQWIKEYSLALAKITLGRVRSKFSGFNSIGNTGIDLDGSDLISEGNQDKEKLEEQVMDNENYDGYYPIMG